MVDLRSKCEILVHEILNLLVSSESRVINFGSQGHQEQTSFQNKYFNLEFTITWMVVEVKNGILEGDNWFLKTFQTLRTCVTNISYVTNMSNQFSFAKIMETNLISHENHKIAMKTANHENQQKTC